ncbi:hypothetical protein J1792_03850 [Streptomyces triculaminicus]|uniref:Uncharacterized protein n=2 Tax=Streptomyces TaxID=1883 RepID=A0A939JPX0_9ACTN|nr:MULTISPECIES: hypothetical protein [Streptomyces]MBO0651959.1 hypothetical protein [Streptomyces triculaminicus]QSY47129.1 hypothetical protein J3S04_17235 [Streptomyces griseocarneus]
MADANPSAAVRSPHAFPMAKPGYGKKSAPGQAPRTATDFAHLPPREAQIAAFVDRLPEGAAMDAKTLAAQLPAYGQAACRTALRRLSEAGHLRRVKEHLKGDDGAYHWVTRTYFSRTARDDAWWTAVLTGNTPRPEAPPAPRSRAYALLATLGRTDPRMTLSHADCVALEPLAAPWLERGATEAEVVRALTAGLPPEVHRAAALARRRLVDKLPPEPQPAAATRLLLVECTVCATPGRPEALPGGLCRDCRGEPHTAALAAPLSPEEVHARAALLRYINREPERNHA